MALRTPPASAVHVRTACRRLSTHHSPLQYMCVQHVHCIHTWPTETCLLLSISVVTRPWVTFKTVHLTCTWSTSIYSLSSTSQLACDVGEVPKWLCCVLMQSNAVVCLVFHGLALVTMGVCVSSPTSCRGDVVILFAPLPCTHARTHTHM